MINELNYDKSSNGCWIWNGKKCSSGRYGYLYIKRKMIMAHRQSFIQHNGEIPNGLFVCHTCDNGLCINPDHLFLGTNSDNMKDAYQKKRLNLNKIHGDCLGEHNPNSKLTEDDVLEIRNYHKENKCGYDKIRQKFGLKSNGHARAIVKKIIWKHI